MLYLYDKSICEDLIKSFNPDNMNNSSVSVIDPEGAISLLAQKSNDDIKFPAVLVNRSKEINVDHTRTNFTRLHKGMQTVFDNETNQFYYEKSLPIELSYNISVLTTNIPDRDELIRELLFKYTSMYFLPLHLPYESNRQLRFGVVIDPDKSIEYNSGSSEYFATGKLYEAIVPLKCEGCILVTYTPVKLRRSEYDIEPINPTH